jgi:pimeloyl-ACP methyl ester carboxylesterase
MTTDNKAAEQHIDLDGIPVVYLQPPDGSPTAPIALWLTHLGGTKESELPALRALAAAGHPAVSFDPPGHGERTTKSNNQVMGWFLAGFRRRMWPLLGLYTLETLRVLDWAAAKLGSHRDFVIGGVSLGGDVAVTVASLDTRVVRVAGLVATPDWTRPGMMRLDDPTTPVDQGEADSYSQWAYDEFEPLHHLGRYERGPLIAFECADEDSHVPPDGAERFKAALLERYPHAGRRVRVTRHPSLEHLQGVRDPKMTEAALRWLEQGG